MRFRLAPVTLAVFSTFLTAASVAHAQQAPDAGRIMQDIQLPQQVLPESLKLDLEAPPAASGGRAEGPEVRLETLRFSGVTRVDEARLHALLAPALGHSYTLAGLRELADRVTRFYREQGYPFARAYLPAQRMSGGELTIDIIEGRYGKIGAKAADAGLAAGADRFLSGLGEGQVIEAQELERTVLILSDQPGIRIRPVVRPGEAVGTGNLEVEVEPTRSLEGRVSADNYGNRYSGKNRLLLEGNWNSPFMLGDRLSAAVLATEEETYFGSVGYSLPLGASGLRGDIGYAHSEYSLGGEFSRLKATGEARVTTLGVSYPLIRSNRANLLLSAHYQYKDMKDEYRATGVSNEKSSHTLPVTLQFDVRDGVFGGGITYGSLGWTHGKLKLDGQAQRTYDRQTADSAGEFDKFNLDLTRLQALPAGFMLSARVAAQWAGKNLDSSEDFVLGGANGVRAYPQGEGVGDEGMLGQLELRYSMGEVMPYLFWDAGYSTINYSEWTRGGDNYRSLSGGGVGVRLNYGKLSVDGAVAWRHQGGEAESDSQQKDPRVWLKLVYVL